MAERYRSGMLPTVQTLTQRLAAGRMPLNDVLRCGSQIIDCLRHAHEEGCCHGALTPDSVILSATGVELIPAESPADRQITAYTAPELLSGQVPDGRSDIFSLGAVLYEMFTGRRAFPGETADEIAASLESSVPEPIGDTAIDRLVLNCLVKDPAGRWHRVQQIHMEFRILLFSAKRAQQLSAPRQREFALQSELRQLESRLHALIDQQYEEGLSEVRHLSAELPLLESQLAARLDRQTAEAATALRHISAELSLMESNLASRLAESHGEAKAGLAHLSAELPLLEARVTSRVDEAISELPVLESRLTSRIEQQESAIAGVELQLISGLGRHDNALAGVQQAVSGLSELESRLDRHESIVANFAELETQLTSRLEQHGSTLTSVQQAISALPELESQLTSRLEQHHTTLEGVEQAISGLSELESRLNSRIDQHESAAAKVPDLESRLLQQTCLLEKLQHAAVEQRATVEKFSQSANAVQENLDALEGKFAAAHENVQRAEAAAGQVTEMAGQQASLMSELYALGTTVKSHASALDSIRASMARNDDFMERIVEALESLQTMVLEQARDRAIA